MDGIITVYKEQGFTSHDVVAKMRGICGMRKIGHTGTLDPNATGVLPVCLGMATKLCDMMTDHDKEYTAGFRLGLTSDTQDIWGEVSHKNEKLAESLSEDRVREVILSFIGDQMQVPPMYSALKVNGRKLYELARAGIEVERQARPVTFFDIDILEMKLPDVLIHVSCSKGTYIRTLCADIGDRLGCGAVMTSLERTRVGNYYKERAFTLAQLQEMKENKSLESALDPVEDFFRGYPIVHVAANGEKMLANGNELKKNQLADLADEGLEKIRIYNGKDIFCGVYQWNPLRKAYTPWKMFLPGTK